MTTNRILVVGIVLALILGIGGRLLLEELKPGGEVAADLGGPFTLVDQDGATVTEAVLKGGPSVLFFGFTHCPEICPTTVYDLDAWLADIGPDAESVRAFFVTVDPERDTPEVLKEYLEPQSERVVGLSGPPEDVYAMADAWRVYRNRIPLDGGGYTMDHTTLLYLVDDEGQYHGLIRYGEDYDSAVAKLRDLIDAS